VLGSNKYSNIDMSQPKGMISVTNVTARQAAVISKERNQATVIKK
jgi:hypothetical protein